MELLESMRVFSKLAELESFTRTADALQMGRPQVTVVIRELEASMGVRLFHRTTRKVRLTPEGDAFLVRVHEILERVSDATTMFSPSGTELKGRLRLDIPSALAVEPFIRSLRAFQQKYPGIGMTLGVTDRIVDLVEENTDCAIRLGDLPDSSLVARRLGTIPMVTCAAPDYLEEFGEPQTPADLLRHKGVAFLSGMSRRALAWTFKVDRQEVLHANKGGILVNDSSAYVACGLAGLGIIQVPELTVRRHLASGQLVEILSDYRPAPKPVSLLLPTRSHIAPHIRAFVDWVVRADVTALKGRSMVFPAGSETAR